jgi:prepilin signal peptidase PulO-like enzyme (type II secretory pathway)
MELLPKILIGLFVLFAILVIADIITTDIALKNKCASEGNPVVAKFYKASIILKSMVIALSGAVVFYAIVVFNNARLLMKC